MTFDEMKHAVQQAKSTQRVADTQVADMARMCADRLRLCGVDIYTLEKLKRELRDFNIHTGSWKDKS